MILADLLPEICHLGLEADRIAHVTEMQRKHGNMLMRIEAGATSHVLKWFAEPSGNEVSAYRLFQQIGVPTIPVHGITEQALLLEDLAVSNDWRLASAEEMEREEVGVALAVWYTGFHTAGYRVCANPERLPAFLMREVDALNAESLQETGEKLGLDGLPGWQLAVVHLESLKRAFRGFPETLNYNDFHWTNLALSREEPLRAIVFDYHLLGIGPAYCDLRNVLGSLGAPARTAFREAYGPVDERVAMFDAPLSELYSLQVAAALPALPAWAKGCVQRISNGEFEKALHRALEAI